MYPTPKLSKYVTLSPFTYKVIHWFSIDMYSSRFITYVISFICAECIGAARAGTATTDKFFPE